MSLRRIAFALGIVALAATLATPAHADQTFWTFSTGPAPKAPPTPSYPNTSIDYVYYGCPQLTMTDGRFNPFDTRGNASTRYRRPTDSCYGQGRRHRRPPVPSPYPGRRFPQSKPLARPT